jgi:hypothetical protein
MSNPRSQAAHLGTCARQPARDSARRTSSSENQRARLPLLQAASAGSHHRTILADLPEQVGAGFSAEQCSAIWNEHREGRQAASRYGDHLAAQFVDICAFFVDHKPSPTQVVMLQCLSPCLFLLSLFIATGLSLSCQHPRWVSSHCFGLELTGFGWS